MSIYTLEDISILEKLFLTDIDKDDIAKIEDAKSKNMNIYIFNPRTKKEAFLLEDGYLLKSSVDEYPALSNQTAIIEDIKNSNHFIFDGRFNSLWSNIEESFNSLENKDYRNTLRMIDSKIYKDISNIDFNCRIQI